MTVIDPREAAQDTGICCGGRIPSRLEIGHYCMPVLHVRPCPYRHKFWDDPIAAMVQRCSCIHYRPLQLCFLCAWSSWAEQCLIVRRVRGARKVQTFLFSSHLTPICLCSAGSVTEHAIMFKKAVRTTSLRCPEAELAKRGLRCSKRSSVE